MNDLSQEARRTLAQARSGQANASPALRARVKANVLGAVAANAGSEPTPSQLSRGSSAKLPAWALPSLGALALAVVGGIAMFAMRRAPAELPHGEPPVLQPSAAVVEAPVAARPSELIAPAQPSPVASEAQVTAAGPSQLERRAKDRGRAPARSASQAAPRDADLRAELHLLSRAEAALQAGDPRSALSILAEHARDFGSGQLRGERDGLRLIAQCALGRDPQRALAGYLREHGDSVLHARIRTSCARFLP